ncbi:MAG: phosphoribosylamine--glycine ligase [Deltaproteobacteria bacterium]|nr:phosphoribosylamine--glycine ligase [Deltaproteobacteria bacterium]
MRVLVVGSGGREHALCWKLKESPLVTALFCAPGNAGTRDVAFNVDIPVTNVGALALWAVENQIDLTVVGPEDPLSRGIANVFEEHGLRIVGPVKEAALLESSKSFAKEIMLKCGVSTPAGAVFTDHAAAKAYVLEHGAPIVVKADGLCAGKGVVVAETVDEAVAALDEFMLQERFGSSGATVVLEERIVGEEASVIVLVDGETILPLVVSQDYKRLKDNGLGPNTGGMGAISPTPVLGEKRLETLVGEIFGPVVAELRSRGIRYRGFLYAGVIVDREGVVRVLEFNCRLGDPETEVILMRLKSDLVEALDALSRGRLKSIELHWKTEAAACVVLASGGYPGEVDDGKMISGLFPPEPGLVVFHAGTVPEGELAKTKGGRVLTVSALGDTLNQAVRRAYEGVQRISFDGMQYRGDIGGGRW